MSPIDSFLQMESQQTGLHHAQYIGTFTGADSHIKDNFSCYLHAQLCNTMLHSLLSYTIIHSVGPDLFSNVREIGQTSNAKGKRYHGCK